MFQNFIRTLGCVALIASVGCGGPQKATQTGNKNASAPKAKVKVVTVQKRLLEDIIVVPTSIEGFEQAMLMPKVAGYVKSVAVNIGDEVTVGDTLVELDLAELGFAQESAQRMAEEVAADKVVRQAEFRAAEAKQKQQQALIDLRQSEFNRFEKLVTRGAIKSQKLEEARFALESAKMELVASEQALDVAASRIAMIDKKMAVAEANAKQAAALAKYQRITAPFSGVITQRSIDSGAFVQPATAGGSTMPILTIARVDKVRAIVHFPMDQAAKLNDGDPAVFKSVGASAREFKGTISRYAKAFDVGTRMMRAEADFDNPIEPSSNTRQIRPGSYGTLTVTVDTAEMLAVPNDAIFEKDGTKHVAIITADGTCKHLSVTVGIVGKDWTGLSHGIEADVRVVAEKPEKIADGKKVSESVLVPWVQKIKEKK